MLTITSLLQKFQTIETEAIIQDSFNDTQYQFELIQQNQLIAGKTNTGDPISPPYKNEKYSTKKNAMNPLPGPGIPDLFLTGSFSKQINAIPEGDRILIFSNDEKAPVLEDKYKNIFGLGTNFKIQYLNENLGPSLREKITNFIGLQFA